MAGCRHDWQELSDGGAVCTLCHKAPTLSVRKPDGSRDVMYVAQDQQEPYHQSALPNLLMVGPRGTGKTLCMRMDAHMRALAVPEFRYLVIRRTMPELRSSHLISVGGEMVRLGGTFHQGFGQARYPNGSIGFYAHCDDVADTFKTLSAQYDLVIPDEITTFPGDLILRIMACVRVPDGSGRIGMLRGGTNPLGVGSEFVKSHFIDKDVPYDENPDYDPDDYGVITQTLEGNAYVDADQYRKRLKALPEHVRKAWLDGEWVIEGMYFTDYRPKLNGKPWHVIQDMPRIDGVPVLQAPWVGIYRCMDWGYYPDPAVCLWIVVLPNKRAIVFHERTWKKTLAADVARDIRRESEGMRVIETFCEPTMLVTTGESPFSIGDIFETHGVPLTPSTNNRELFGYAINNYLHTEIDGLPQLQIMERGAPKLVQTLPTMRTGSPDPAKIADGNDHWVVALAYFCMGGALPSVNPEVSGVPKWMQPKRPLRYGGIYS